jgi:uncharacterized membrane protein YeaQ/YmgE (transglycosylase-associated protein family)
VTPTPPTPGPAASLTPAPASSLTFALTPADLTHWVLLLLIAALAGLLVEVLRGGAVPGGPLGGIAAALLGAWLGADLLYPRLPPLAQPLLDNVALIPAAGGALIVAYVFSLLAGNSGRRRRGFY